MMKKIIAFSSLIINPLLLFGQTALTIEGTVVNNTESGTWTGVNIQRSVPTTFIYRNNLITSVNATGYMLQAGDESPNSNNNNLDGEVITGNKLVWNGTDMNSITHGIFTGHNINALIKYNYLDKVPMAIIRKSTTGMTNTSGGVAYNIVKNPVATAGVAKGMNNVSFYNNTFYSNLSSPWRGLIDIYTNTDITPNVASKGAKIKNNIFYTVNQIYNIAIHDAACLPNFESDYNVFYCESGTPLFNYLETVKTFVQWQALGYDIHSVVVNPNFINTNDFVPAVRLNYGVDLGATWLTGLATTANWTPGVSPATVNQNGAWQVGARIYDAALVSPSYVSSVVENATPSILEITYDLSLNSTVIPAVSSFNVLVNSVTRAVSAVTISGKTVQLTLVSAIKYGDIVTVAYTKPANNPLTSVSGGVAASISSRSVINNLTVPVIDAAPVKIVMTISPNHIHKVINVLLTYSSTPTAALAPQVIRITDLYGNLFVEKVLVTGITDIRIPLNLRSGVYIVLMLANELEMASQKMMVY